MTKEVLYIIDLDRTLVDVSKVMKFTEVVCNEIGIDFAKIYETQQDLHSRGTAYSPISYIKAQSGQKVVKFKNFFIELAREDKLLFDDARQLLTQLNQKNRDIMVLTHGAEEDWQLLKLEATSLISIPHIIVNTRRKSAIIRSWVTKDGRYKPSLKGLSTYKSCVFIDDRMEAFDEFPDNCEGYLLDRTGNYKNDKKLPRNIKIINTLSEVSIV